MTEQGRNPATGLAAGAIRPLIAAQIGAGLAGLVPMLIWLPLIHAWSYLFGVGLMVINAFWLARRIEAAAGRDARAGRRSLLQGAALRFAAMIAALAIGALAGLHLLFVAAGMFVAMAALYLMALLRLRLDRR